MDIFYLFPNSKLMDVISMWSDSMTELGSSSTHARTIRLTYRNRLSFKTRRGQETDREYSKDVLNDYYLVPSLDIALDIIARMAQIDYGDCSSLTNAQDIAKDAVRRFCCRKFTMNILPHDMELLSSLPFPFLAVHVSDDLFLFCPPGVPFLFLVAVELVVLFLFPCFDDDEVGQVEMLPILFSFLVVSLDIGPEVFH
uniref:Uncharacterized protein n=1 Tax=Amphimedon queenslandica TaxID=400682 RepID=A0A1X7ULW8_AMPQE